MKKHTFLDKASSSAGAEVDSPAPTFLCQVILSYQWLVMATGEFIHVGSGNSCMPQGKTRSNVPYWLQVSQIFYKNRFPNAKLTESKCWIIMPANEHNQLHTKKSSSKRCKWWTCFKDFKHYGQTFGETPKCSSCACSRSKIRNIEFITLNDGRNLCPDCHSSAILDLESCHALVSEVHNFYGGLNMHMRKDIPVLLLDQIEMNRLAINPNNDQDITLGMTIYNEREAITCVKGSSQIGTNIEVLTQVVNLPRHCPVTGMLLLYGYPKLHIGATLAHEMMHTWLTLQGYPELELKTEEGICELMAYKYIESYDFSGEDMNGADQRSHQFMRNFKEYLKYKMEGNDCKIYGDGFREAKLAVETHGFDYTMQYIFEKGKFPK